MVGASAALGPRTVVAALARTPDAFASVDAGTARGCPLGGIARGAGASHGVTRAVRRLMSALLRRM